MGDKTEAMHLARSKERPASRMRGRACSQEGWPDAHLRLCAAEAALASGEDAVAREQVRIVGDRVKCLPATAPVVAGIEGLAVTMRLEIGRKFSIGKTGLLPHRWVMSGRGGRAVPPRWSMARAMSASGERNPTAIRFVSRMRVFTLRAVALDRSLTTLA